MAEPDLPDELQPRMFAQAGHRLGDLEHRAHDVMATVPQSPQLLQSFHRLLDLALPTRFYHGLHLDRMRRVYHLEHILPTHETEAGSCRL